MNNIRALRKEKGMTLDDLSRIFNVSRATLGFWEQGKYEPNNALLLGVPKKYVAVMMGHKGDQMLDKIYAHTFKTPQASFEEQIAASSDNFFR